MHAVANDFTSNNKEANILEIQEERVETSSTAQVLINEVMSSNSISIQDEDGDHSDWIELYNPGEIEVNLFNRTLRLNSKNIPPKPHPMRLSN